jgi:hypothetical protein
MAGCAKLSLLDAYSGYNEIKLKVEDEEKLLSSPLIEFSVTRL